MTSRPTTIRNTKSHGGLIITDESEATLMRRGEALKLAAELRRTDDGWKYVAEYNKADPLYSKVACYDETGEFVAYL